MEIKAQHAQQADLPTSARRLVRTTRGPLGTLTLIAFLGYILMYFVAFSVVLFVEGIFFLPMLLFPAFMLLAAGLAPGLSVATFFILLAGLLYGILPGILYGAVKKYLPGPGLLKGVTFGLLGVSADRTAHLPDP